MKLGNYIQLFRFNESGDFFTQDCIKKLDEISRYLTDKWNIITYGYTARSDLDFSNVSFKVKSSGYDNGNNGRVEVIKSIRDLSDDYRLCPRDCGKCTFCTIYGDVAFLLHGKRRNKLTNHKNNKNYVKYNGLEISLGNSKLDDTIMILNMGDSSTCPAEHLCKWPEFCYAKHVELMYEKVRKYRERQKKYWLSRSVKEIINDFDIVLTKERKRKERKGNG